MKINRCYFGVVFLLIAPLSVWSQTTVFQDKFGSSILNPTTTSPGTLNSTTTAYEIASSKNATGTTISSGSLAIGPVASGSGYAEAQALFTATPVTLSAAGQYIEVYYTFTDTNNLFNNYGNNAEQINVGLYNSGGGSAPTNGTLLWNAGLASGSTTAIIGACKGWVGYTAEFSYSSNSAQSSAIATRPSQTTVANNTCQGLGYGSGYSSGANLVTMAGVAGQPLLTAGSQYTMHLRITYVNASTLAITNTLYSGSGIGGPVVSSGGWTGKFGVQASSPVTMTFDGLEVGMRPNAGTANPVSLLVNSITVATYIPVAPTVAGVTNQTIIQGSNATLSATVTGVPTPGLQWFLSTDGGATSNAIANATSATLSLNNVQYSQNNYVYSLVAANLAGTNSSSMTLSVIVPPGITGLYNQPASPGSTVTINPSVSGVPTPSLQWQYNGVNLADGPTLHGSVISGSTGNPLTILNAQLADTGTYSLIASNSIGIATNSMVLTVTTGNVAPALYGPTNITVIQGSNGMFSAAATGIPSPTLQWLDQTGAPITGANGSSLMLTNVQYVQNGYSYSLVASNSSGMVTNGAFLTVLVPVSITAPPTNIAVVVGTPAVFHVTASGVPAPNYQWNRNGSPIAGATNASYTFSNPQGADNGVVFSVMASNSVNSVTSSGAALTVLSTMTGTFLPTNGAVNLSPDQQLRIVFAGGTPFLNTNGMFTVRDAADNSVVQTIDASQFLSYTPGNTSIQTIPNAAIRTEQGTYFGSGTGTTTYYYMPIALYGNEAWITLTNRLAYGHTYYATCDTGLFLDSTGASFAGVAGTNTCRFSTKISGPATPTTNSGPTSITVGQDGTGDFATFQGAFDWIPQSNILARVIHVLPGIYRDSATLAGNRNFVTIVGDGASRTNAQLIYPFVYFAPPNPVFTAGSLRIESSDVAVENLTLDNIIYGVYHPTGYSSSGAATSFAGAINTLATTGNRIVFNNVLIKGGQDTIYNVFDKGVVYYYNSEVWGSVDFIYGAALGVFDHCNIVEIRSTGGPCTAPNTAYAQPYGMTFLNCTFPQAFVANGYPYDVGAATTTYMRPWGKDGMTAAINCAIGNQFSAAAYQTFGNTNEDECRAREYGTTLIGGAAPNIPTNRWNAGAYWANTYDPDYVNSVMDPTDPLLAPPTGTNNRVAVTINPNDYTLSAIFGNSYFNLNGWMPAIMPVVTRQPANQTINAGSNAVFIVTAVGLSDPSYQWLKNGTNLAGQTGAMLTISNASGFDIGTYSVVVTNSAGAVASSNAVLTVNFPATAPALTSATVVSGGSVQFSITSANGSAGFGYRVWATTNLALRPVTNTWTLLTNGIFGASPISFADSSTTNQPQRFYLITVP